MFSDEIDRIEAGLPDIIAALQGVSPPDAPKVPVSGRYSCQMRQLERKLRQVAQGIGALNLYSLTNAGAGFAHSDLAGREAEEQHPIAAISGLLTALEGKADQTVTGERYHLRIRTDAAAGVWLEVVNLTTQAVARTGIRIATDGTLQGELAWEGTQGVACIIRQDGIYLKEGSGEYKILDLRDSQTLTEALQAYTDQRVAALRTDALVWQGSRKESELPSSGHHKGDYYWITDFDVTYPGQGKKGSAAWTVPAEGSPSWDIQIDAYREPDGITIVSRMSDGALQVAPITVEELTPDASDYTAEVMGEFHDVLEGMLKKIRGLFALMATKEPGFTKKTAFNRDFGSVGEDRVYPGYRVTPGGSSEKWVKLASFPADHSSGGVVCFEGFLFVDNASSPGSTYFFINWNRGTGEGSIGQNLSSTHPVRIPIRVGYVLQADDAVSCYLYTEGGRRAQIRCVRDINVTVETDFPFVESAPTGMVYATVSADIPSPEEPSVPGTIPLATLTGVGGLVASAQSLEGMVNPQTGILTLNGLQEILQQLTQGSNPYVVQGDSTVDDGLSLIIGRIKVIYRSTGNNQSRLYITSSSEETFHVDWRFYEVYDNTGTVGHRSQDTALYPATDTDAANSNLYNNNNATNYLLIRDIDRHEVYEVFCYPAANGARVTLWARRIV